MNASAVVATRDRAAILKRALQSLASQSAQPSEIIIVDASSGEDTLRLCLSGVRGLRSILRWIKANKPGAAVQRAQGVGLAKESIIWFFDDDVLFEPDCVIRLWSGLEADERLGGISAMIVNQRYEPPGMISHSMFTLMNGEREKTFAGKMIGPAINLLPEDREDLPEIVEVEWLNLGCTMYRADSLPKPPFDPFFNGYSLMEDAALSSQVRLAGWKLANARTARIFHDSQPADYKSDIRARAAMELVNRHYVMTKILGRRALTDYTRLVGWELFQLASCVIHPASCQSIFAHIVGKLDGIRRILSNE